MPTTWRIESKTNGAGHTVAGSFDDALVEAIGQCPAEPCTGWVVWAEPANVRMAEVNHRGAVWVKNTLIGKDVKQLMRRHHITIKELAFVMGITERRIRDVREKGLHCKHAVRDWLEAITEVDVGPLPERFRISSRDEYTDCPECGIPLDRGDTAYEYAGGVYCSITCSRRSRGWGVNATVEVG